MSLNEVWTLAEQRNGIIQAVSYELLNRARALADKLNVPLAAVLMGYDIPANEVQELIYRGADKVYLIEHEMIKDFLVEPYSSVLCCMIDMYSPQIVIAAATSTGRTVLPHVAMRKRAGLTADCTILDIEEGTGNLLQTRPAIGGNILATIKTPEARPQMATVRPHSMKPAPRDIKRTGEVIRPVLPYECFVSRAKKLGFIEDKSQEISLQQADAVVAGGRGLGKAENFKYIEELAKLLGGAVGASRDVVDRGWVTYPHQVGLSGKTVTPKLYMAIGISGAIQHIAGMQTSETIVAINKDPDAQIFKLADFGIVGDAMEVLPVLIEKLKQYTAQREQEAVK
ncbi:MAG: electron transfer flavoprotein alpha subunit [Clostridiales bacterium]|jgi:electron transfer flavoprotein alpha subunit|nr:electron transfer flavoprotein alpha subunit [Clostridiales bacterium]